MNVIQENAPITMVRDNLEGIPDHSLPEGFILRGYQPGDQKLWEEIHLLADRYLTPTSDLFHREFGTDEAVLAERQLYLLAADGQAIGTATAWFNDNFRGRAYGRVHWVAIVPRYQGQGLAKPLMAAVCCRLRELGHDRAYLTTSTARVPAVRLYMQFGFLPWPEGAGDVRVWRRFERELGLTRTPGWRFDGTPWPGP